MNPRNAVRKICMRSASYFRRRRPPPLLLSTAENLSENSQRLRGTSLRGFSRRKTRRTRRRSFFAPARTSTPRRSVFETKTRPGRRRMMTTTTTTTKIQFRSPRPRDHKMTRATNEDSHRHKRRPRPRERTKLRAPSRTTGAFRRVRVA